MVSVTASSTVRAKRSNPIGASTYTFWRFNGPMEGYPIETCIDQAVVKGFDGIGLLHTKVAPDEPDFLQGLVLRALVYDLDLIGFSTYQRLHVLM